MLIYLADICPSVPNPCGSYCEHDLSGAKNRGEYMREVFCTLVSNVCLSNLRTFSSMC